MPPGAGPLVPIHAKTYEKHFKTKKVYVVWADRFKALKYKRFWLNLDSGGVDNGGNIR